MAPFQIEYKASGSALFLAVVISLVVALLSGMFLFASYIHNVELSSNFIKARLLIDARSGMILLVSGAQKTDEQKNTVLDLYGKGEDSVRLSLRNYGIFQVASSTAFLRNMKETRLALVGEPFDSMNRTSVYFPDQNMALALAGNTKIIGDAYLPSQGVKASQVENKLYTRKELIHGVIKHSNHMLPQLNLAVLDSNYRCLHGHFSQWDSIVNNLTLRDTIINSFSGKRIVLFYTHKIDVNNNTIRGNVLIYSSEGITLSAKTIMNNAILYAPYVIVKQGFKGKLQIFASDSVILEKNAKLEYPSAIILIDRKRRITENIVRLGQNATISGFVFLKNFGTMNKVAPHLFMDGKSMIYGTLFSDGISELGGVINGTAFFNRVVLKSGMANYENNLLDVTIDNSKLSRYFVNSVLMTSHSDKAIFKWLN